MVKTRDLQPSSRLPKRALSGEVVARRIFAGDWSRRTKRLKLLVDPAHGKLSVDDVHDLRVTTRRLRASLSVLLHGMESKAARKAHRKLRTLGLALGERRMWDIAMRDAITYQLSTATMKKRHARSSQALQRALGKKRIDVLLAGLDEVEPEISLIPFERVGPWLASFEWELAYRLLQPPRTPKARHQLRIQMKKVRYVLESFGRSSRSLRKLQDHLGREHDLVVLQTYVGRKANVARDARRERLRADKVRGPALRSAMRNLRALRRDIAR